MIKILVVDDHPYINHGLISVFEGHKEISIVGSALSGVEALSFLKKNDVDIVILDIIMPEMNGVECCTRIKADYPNTKVIAFTGEMDPQSLYNIWTKKADAILNKNCGLEDLISTIKSVKSGQKIIGDNIPNFFEPDPDQSSTKPKLTKTEIEVLKLLATGLTRQEAADKMNRSMYTVEFHCKNIFRKFGNNRVHSVITEAKRKRIIM